MPYIKELEKGTKLRNILIKKQGLNYNLLNLLSVSCMLRTVLSKEPYLVINKRAKEPTVPTGKTPLEEVITSSGSAVKVKWRMNNACG